MPSAAPYWSIQICCQFRSDTYALLYEGGASDSGRLFVFSVALYRNDECITIPETHLQDSEKR